MTLPVTISIPGHVTQTVQMQPVPVVVPPPVIIPPVIPPVVPPIIPPPPPGNKAPVVRITAPLPGASFVEGTQVTLAGSATDAEDGALHGQALKWFEGATQFSSGSTFKKVFPVGTHAVELRATDSKGAAGIATVSFTVTSASLPPVVPPILPPPVIIPPPIIRPPSGRRYSDLGNAELPRTLLTYTSTNGALTGWGTTRSPTTPAGLATAITDTVAGDTIVLARGTCYNDATYYTQTFGVKDPYDNGIFVGFRVITSGTASIAAPGNKILASQRHATPHFQCQLNNTECILIQAAATGWNFVGIQADEGTRTSVYGVAIVGPVHFETWSGAVTYGIGRRADNRISIQNGNLNHAVSDTAWWRPTNSSDLSHKNSFDRCDIAFKNHQTVSAGQIAVQVAARELICYGCLFYSEGMTATEDKAFFSNTSEGPFLFKRCDIIASAINILIGGATPSFATVTSDIEFDECNFETPIHMIADDAAWDTKVRMFKNNWELKSARRVWVRRSRFKNAYDGVQSQYFTVCIKNDGTHAASETCDVTIQDSIFDDIAGAFTVGTLDGSTRVDVVHNVAIFNNYTPTPLGGLNNAALGKRSLTNILNITDTTRHLYFGFNTFIHTPTLKGRGWCMGVLANGYTGIVVEGNLLTAGCGPEGDTTVYGGISQINSVTHEGKDAFLGPSSICTKNWMYDKDNACSAASSKYTAPELNRTTTAANVFLDYAGGNYRPAVALAGQGPRGLTPGANIDQINALTLHCSDGLFV